MLCPEVSYPMAPTSAVSGLLFRDDSQTTTVVGSIPILGRRPDVLGPTVSEISRFNPNLPEHLVSHYYHLDYVKVLNHSGHKGRGFPPAAYTILSDNMDRYITENQDVIRELEIEMSRFPQT